MCKRHVALTHVCCVAILPVPTDPISRRPLIIGRHLACLYAGDLLPPNWKAIDKIFKKVYKGLIKKIGKKIFVSQTLTRLITPEDGGFPHFPHS